MTIQLPADLESSLRAEVSRGHFASVDEAVAEAVRPFLRERPNGQVGEETLAPSGESAFDVLNRAGLIGCVEGRPDSPTNLSTNPAQMEGFGRG